jgi:hypothetical protein
MRSITILCGAVLIVGCMTAIPAHAQNDVMGNVQRFLGIGNNGNDRNAYEQGRRDEMAQQQADRERRREERQQYGDRGYDPQYHYQRNGYTDRYSDQRNGGY